MLSYTLLERLLVTASLVAKTKHVRNGLKKEALFGLVARGLFSCLSFMKS